MKKTDLVDTIDVSCKKMFGRGISDLDITVIFFNRYYGVLRCPHRLKDQMINLLKSIDTIDSSPVKVNTITTSGTVKALLRRTGGIPLRRNRREPPKDL